jgi:serpin B
MSKPAWLLIVSCLGSACGDDSTAVQAESPRGVTLAKSALARESDPSNDHVGALGSGNRAFAFDLFHQIARGSAGQNLVLSPYSVSTALAMAYAGARTQTATEIQSTLHFDVAQPQLHEAFNAVDLQLVNRGTGEAGADGTPFRLNVSNSLWAQRNYTIEPAFLDTLALNYGAGVFLADFANQPDDARVAINGWVSQQTDKLISELLPAGSINVSTRLVLTNTVYFNASWQTKFQEADTHDAPFSKLDGSQVSVPMMHNALAIPYAAGDGYEAVAIPYAGGALRLIAVLPEPGAYERVEASLNGPWFDALSKQLSAGGLILAFPKLDYAAHTSLKTQLQALGMHGAFEEDADFSGITEDEIFVEDVIHEAVLKVFESGTIAAAATAVTFADASAIFPDHTVTFDHPFFFAIADEPTGELLFLGRVLDPTAK